LKHRQQPAPVLMRHWTPFQEGKTMNMKFSEVPLADLGYVRTAAAAAYLGIGKSTLERKRIDGSGPRFRVLGKKIIVYSMRDLDGWASEHVLSSTSEKTAA
jgi:predicted DNA-binding transcriptional regulator AlpA